MVTGHWQKNHHWQNLNIGVLIPQFPGQTHIFFWNEIAALERLGASVNLFSTRLPPQGLISHDWSDQAIDRTTYLGRIRPVSALLALLGLPWAELFGEIRREGLTLLKDILICAAPARQLLKDCQNQSITHVHAHSCGRAALIAALANRLGGLSYSLTLHGPMSDYGSSQPFKWRRATFATIITRKLLTEARDELGPDFPAQIAVQPMGVDTAVLKRDTDYLPPEPNGPVKLFTCARLNVAKGHQDLIQAMRKLVDQGRDIHLTIAGEDDDGGNGYHLVLKELIDNLGLQNHVELLGAISTVAVKKHLLDSHVFVLASWHEPLGVAYMEAMSCAVPTIGTNAGGVPELMTNGQDGVLVTPKNPDALAAAIVDLINDSERCIALSKAGRTQIEKHFHSDNGAEMILGLITATSGFPVKQSAQTG
jgi:colanic acid/amylovoran biosynthesis glycosyltransferase